MGIVESEEIKVPKCRDGRSINWKGMGRDEKRRLLEGRAVGDRAPFNVSAGRHVMTTVFIIMEGVDFPDLFIAEC
jgi:hypothetical protein